MCVVTLFHLTMRLEQQPLSVPSEHQLDAIRRDFATSTLWLVSANYYKQPPVCIYSLYLPPVCTCHTVENYLRTPTLTIMEHHSHQVGCRSSQPRFNSCTKPPTNPPGGAHQLGQLGGPTHTHWRATLCSSPRLPSSCSNWLPKVYNC